MSRDLADLIESGSALQPGETVLAHVRPAGRLLGAEILQAVAIFSLTIVLPAVVYAWLRVEMGLPDRGLLEEGFGAGALTLEIIFFGPRLVQAWIQVTFTRYTLTTDRIYTRTEFLSTDLKVVPYEKVSHLQLRRGLFDRIFRIAELGVRAYGAEEGHLRMRGLPDPLPLYAVCRERLRIHNSTPALLRSD